MQGRLWFAAVTGLLMALPGLAGAGSNVVLPRPGQVGIGMQGQFGLLTKTGDYGDLFDNGPGLTVRLRYRMRYERAIGLTFEGQEFDSRVAGVAGDTTLKRLTLIMSGFEVYQMFGTQDLTTRLLSAGAGLVQASAKLSDNETIFPDDGVYLSAGAGIERFFWRSWAFDLSTRYFAVFQHHKTNHDVQASAGLIFYASY